MDLCETFINLIDLKISKPKFRVFLKVFLFKTPTQFWDCGPDLLIHNTGWLGCNNIKIPILLAIYEVKTKKKRKVT